MKINHIFFSFFCFVDRSSIPVNVLSLEINQERQTNKQETRTSFSNYDVWRPPRIAFKKMAHLASDKMSNQYKGC